MAVAIFPCKPISTKVGFFVDEGDFACIGKQVCQVSISFVGVSLTTLGSSVVQKGAGGSACSGACSLMLTVRWLFINGNMLHLAFHKTKSVIRLFVLSAWTVLLRLIF